MSLICFNKAEITGDLSLGNTYRIKTMGVTFNFAPVMIKESSVPCYGSIDVVIGYTDMGDSYTEAMSKRISAEGNRVEKSELPTINGVPKMLITEKYHENFDIEGGIESSKEEANRLRRHDN